MAGGAGIGKTDATDVLSVQASQIQITEEVKNEAYERVRDQVEAKPCAPLHVKGKSEALEEYELLGLKQLLPE
jgi:hypothetical protein